MERKQEHWGGLAAGFFFLSSMGAMLFVFTAIMDFANSPLIALEGGWFGLAACVLMGLGGMMLFAELGNKMKAYMLHKPCIMLLGAASMAVAAVCAILYATFFLNVPWAGVVWLRRLIAAVGLICAVILTVYPGPEMAEACGRPFWRKGGLMILFLLAGTAAGLAAMLMIGSIGTADTMFGDYRLFAAVAEVQDLVFLRTVFAVALVLLLIVLFAYLMTVKGKGFAAEFSVNNILKGDFKISFWLGTVIIGIILPLICCLLPYFPGAMVIAAVGAIIGGACLRAIILFAGVRVVLPGEENEFLEQDEITALAEALTARWDEKARWLSGR